MTTHTDATVIDHIYLDLTMYDHLDNEVDVTFTLDSMEVASKWLGLNTVPVFDSMNHISHRTIVLGTYGVLKVQKVQVRTCTTLFEDEYIDD